LTALGSDSSHQAGDGAGEPRSLRSLECDGLITRTATPAVAVTVSYELTDLGLSLHQMIRGIRTWAQTHMDEVFANRAAYDTHAGSQA
jgi:DNA-binding HxlR family transcriptional regulator